MADADHSMPARSSMLTWLAGYPWCFEQKEEDARVSCLFESLGTCHMSELPDCSRAERLEEVVRSERISKSARMRMVAGPLSRTGVDMNDRLLDSTSPEGCPSHGQRGTMWLVLLT